MYSSYPGRQAKSSCCCQDRDLAPDVGHGGQRDHLPEHDAQPTKGSRRPRARLEEVARLPSAFTYLEWFARVGLEKISSHAFSTVNPEAVLVRHSRPSEHPFSGKLHRKHLMSLLISRLGVWLLGGVAAAAGWGKPRLQLPKEDRVRIAEAQRLADQVCDGLWSGWGRTAFPILLVTDSAEFLVGHRGPAGDFASLGYDSVLGSEVWTRPRRFPSTLLATFPAVGGVPTVVIGSAARTNKSSTDWVLTLLHEHFHQWQYSQPDYYSGVSRLGLSHGDRTGQWMLDYAFPYDSVSVQKAMRSLATALTRALESPSGARVKAANDVVHARDTLRSLLTADDYRYLEFQLWQEGMARFMEYAAARAATMSKQPSVEFRSLPDYQPYGRIVASDSLSLRQQLEQLDLGRQRRVAFYPIGAAIALLLEKTRHDWKQGYARRPFELLALLSTAR